MRKYAVDEDLQTMEIENWKNEATNKEKKIDFSSHGPAGLLVLKKKLNHLKSESQEKYLQLVHKMLFSITTTTQLIPLQLVPQNSWKRFD